jgi:NADH dehydrogenase
VSARVVVTGANGAIGRAIVAAALVRPPAEAVDSAARLEVIAAVRSERAARQVPVIPAGHGRLARIAYDDPTSLDEALAGATALIHLPGLLVERRGSSYEQANVETTRVAVASAVRLGLGKLVLVSACGADARSANRFFQSKGIAEQVVRDAGVPFTILRAPLVLGPGTEGSRALARDSARSSVRLPAGGRTLHQPLDVEDLAEAALHAALDPDTARDRALDLVGPESLRYRELVARAAALQGHDIHIRSVPAGPLRALLALRRRLLGPGFDPDALEVLLTDTRLDAGEAAAAVAGLRIHPTPLDVTMRRGLELEEKR